MQERDDALLRNQQQVEKDRDVASLEEQHAAVIASMRSELNAAETAAKAEQQHREELHNAASKAEQQHREVLNIAAAKTDQRHREELQQQKQIFEHQIATLQASVLGLQQVMLTVLPVLLARVGCISV